MSDVEVLQMIACVRVLHFALRLQLLEYPERDGEPLVLSPAQGDRRKVLDCTPEASALYIRRGMAIRDVLAMNPNAIVVEANPAREAAANQRIIADLETLSPLVEADAQEPGCWYIDLGGLGRLLGPMPSIARQLLGLMSPLLRPRVGIAESKFAARVAAGRAAAGAFLIVDPAETVAFLAVESVESLPHSPGMILLLKQLGIETLGHLAALSPSAIAARLGPAGRSAWDLAGGKDPSRVVGQQHRDVLRERMELPAPASSRETVLYALRLLAEQVSRQPQMRNRGARQVLVRAVYENGGSWEKQIAMREPVQGSRLAELLRLRFQALDLPQPVSELEIELSNLSNPGGRQALLDGVRARDDRPVIEADHQLKGRYDRSSLFHVVGVEPWSRLPERRYSMMPYEPVTADEPKSLNLPQPIAIESRPSPRGKPEPAALIGKKRRQEVKRIEDCWIVDEEWWLRPIKRRYFQVRMENGALRTLYHDLGDQQWYAQNY
jgi:DNA polymerase-4/protein ImuB